MQDRKQQGDLADDRTGTAHGAQGIDKAPGEESAGDLQDTVSQTQRGKNKVDGDPEKASDQPIDQDQ